MLSGAPPMFVVGVMVQVAVLAIRLVAEFVFDRPLYGEAGTALYVSTQLVSCLMIGFGALELARRTRRRQRIATGVAGAAQLVLVVVTIMLLWITMRMRMQIGTDDFDIERGWYHVVLQAQ